MIKTNLPATIGITHHLEILSSRFARQAFKSRSQINRLAAQQAATFEANDEVRVILEQMSGKSSADVIADARVSAQSDPDCPAAKALRAMKRQRPAARDDLKTLNNPHARSWCERRQYVASALGTTEASLFYAITDHRMHGIGLSHGKIAARIDAASVSLSNEDALYGDLPILTANAAAVYEFLLAQPPHLGFDIKRLLDEMARSGIIIDNTEFYGRIRPQLELYGMENRPQVGYRIPVSRRPKNS